MICPGGTKRHGSIGQLMTKHHQRVRTQWWSKALKAARSDDFFHDLRCEVDVAVSDAVHQARCQAAPVMFRGVWRVEGLVPKTSSTTREATVMLMPGEVELQ
jgi:hypothetical protein